MTEDARVRIAVIVCSTRPGRVGDKVGARLHALASGEGSIVPALLDLADFALPLYDEPRHSRFGDYEHAHTRRWATAIGASDGFVFVAPEYNHGPSPALINALTYLGPEWALKPAGFVSYGGRSGGLRAVQLTKPILNALKMYPTKAGVVIPSVKDFVAGDHFVATEQHEREALGFLQELVSLSVGMRGLR